MFDDDKLYRDIEVAQRLEISRSTVWSWVRKGELTPPIRKGGWTRFYGRRLNEDLGLET